MSENAFEWIDGDQKCRVEVKDGIGHYAEEVVYPDGTSWTEITWYGETEVKPIDALLRERTARADVFARLKAQADEAAMLLPHEARAVIERKLDALRVEWERGEA